MSPGLESARSRLFALARRAIRVGGLFAIHRLHPATVRSLANVLSPSVKARVRSIVFAAGASAPEEGSALKDLVMRSLPSVASLDADLAWITNAHVATLPVIRPLASLNFHRLLFEFVRAMGARTRFIVLLNALTRGGADLYAVSIFKALAHEFGPDSVTFLVTDRRVETARDWLPDDAHVVFMDDLQEGLDLGTKSDLLVQMIAAVRPQAIFNVNSRIIWDYITTIGAPLRAYTALYSSLFCYEYRDDGVEGGYAAFNFRDGLASHTGIVFDNEVFRRELIAKHAVPPSMRSRLLTLHTPLQDLEAAEYVVPDPEKAGVVLWAGRFVFQKLPLLAIEVARLCPEYEFHMHGEGDPELTRKMKETAPPNVKFFGRFKSMESLLRQGYGLMLYTSVTDGVPTVIQGAARFGVAVVASATGGIPELVRPDTGWPVQETDAPEAYADAIRGALSDLEERQARVTRMRELVLSQHDPQRFATKLRSFVEKTSHAHP